LGRVSKSISAELEQTMFGINLIMILILQEKDQVHGEIKYSLIPLALNNGYMLWSNLQQVRQIFSQPSSSINKKKVYLSVAFYLVSGVAYGLMESYNQGLHLETSQ
jgi:hypothetical protein